jgi:hypothetical protein
VIGCSPEEVLGEVAYIAYHFHWPHEEVMQLDRVERRQWVAEISSINERLNQGRSIEVGRW